MRLSRARLKKSEAPCFDFIFNPARPWPIEAIRHRFAEIVR